MEPLKPRDKVTQHMTRDGLTLDNQTTGESVNVSAGRPSRNTPPSRRARRKNTGTGGRTARPPQGKESGQGRRGNRGAGHRPCFPVAVYRRGTGLPELAPYIKRQKNGRISWKQPKKPCRKSVSSPRKPFMTRPRARPKAGCILTRWRNPSPAQTKPGQPPHTGSRALPPRKNP